MISLHLQPDACGIKLPWVVFSELIFYIEKTPKFPSFLGGDGDIVSFLQDIAWEVMGVGNVVLGMLKLGAGGCSRGEVPRDSS